MQHQYVSPYLVAVDKKSLAVIFRRLLTVLTSADTSPCDLGLSDYSETTTHINSNQIVIHARGSLVGSSCAQGCHRNMVTSAIVLCLCSPVRVGTWVLVKIGSQTLFAGLEELEIEKESIT